MFKSLIKRILKARLLAIFVYYLYCENITHKSLFVQLEKHHSRDFVKISFSLSVSLKLSFCLSVFLSLFLALQPSTIISFSLIITHLCLSIRLSICNLCTIISKDTIVSIFDYICLSHVQCIWSWQYIKSIQIHIFKRKLFIYFNRNCLILPRISQKIKYHILICLSLQCCHVVDCTLERITYQP